MQAIDLSLQTQFADLIERCELADFDRDFPAGGNFYPVDRNERRYWYFKPGGNQKTRYVGPESSALLDRIARHGQIKESDARRRDVVKALRAGGLPVPDDLSGRVLDALNRAGLFRLRAVLIGTQAFQTYAGLLGVKLPGASLRTSDLDIAQFHSIATVIEDSIPPVIDVLRQVDPTFRAVERTRPGEPPANYINSAGFRVDVLTPNQGSDDVEGTALAMPSLAGTGAVALRMLDLLIHQPQRAVVLHEGGVFVWVPDPARFALHKLMLPSRRNETATGVKADKDMAQAAALIEALAVRRPADLKDLWQEARARGPAWQKALDDGRKQLPDDTRTALDRAVA